MMVMELVDRAKSEFSAAQTTTEAVEASRERTVIIIGLPWFRTGTGQVMQAQVNYFKRSGWNTVFVCVPRFADDFSTNSRVQGVLRRARELAADHTFVADYNPSAKQKLRDVMKSFFAFVSRRLKGLPSCSIGQAQMDAMQQAMLATDSCEAPEDLLKLLADQKPELLLVNHVYSMAFSEKLMHSISRQQVRPALVAVTHDVQTMILMDNDLIPDASPGHAIDHLAEMSTELHHLATADVLVHVGHSDELFFKKRLPEIPHVTAFPHVDAQNLSPSSSDHLNATDFIFVGANHIANFAAIIWFLEEVLPQFNRSPPSIKIIGSVGEGMKIHHSAVYQAHEQLFIGEVEDISQYYMNATAVLAPMRSGRGISIKTIEAAAAGKPVIGLAHAYRGIPEQTVLDCGIEVAKNAEEFAYLMQKVLQDPAPMIAASCRLHNALFTCEQFAASMDRAVELACGAPKRWKSPR
jgi:hypothetical protein